MSAALKLIVAIVCILIQWRGAEAQQSSQQNDGLRDDISALRRDINTVEGELREVIGQLNALKSSLIVSAKPLPPVELIKLDPLGQSPRGKSTARIAIVEYSDFECPFCGKYERETSPLILKNYVNTGKVKVFYRDLPSPMHPRAIPAARAARCAGEQGKFWEMHDSLFAGQGALSDGALLDRAMVLGLDSGKFNECFSSTRHTDNLQKELTEAEKIGIDGTPTFFIGPLDESGDVMTVAAKIAGSHPYEAFRSAFEEVLALQNVRSVQNH
jgi:protein-disulfide isomerase